VGRELVRLTLPVPPALDDALEAFDCCGDKFADDEVAQEVRAYLAEGSYLLGLEQDVTSTYLFLETDESPPLLVGYVAVALGVVKLSGSEKRNLGEPEFSDFGAIRLVMIGVDVAYQGQTVGDEGQKVGDELLDAVVGLARRVGQTISVRFLIADANRRLKDWYEAHKFEVNRSGDYKPEDESRSTLSMRLDLRKRDV
jgi:ribosomal protein S18 acetylase RimI-like enzyme